MLKIKENYPINDIYYTDLDYGDLFKWDITSPIYMKIDNDGVDSCISYINIQTAKVCIKTPDIGNRTVIKLDGELKVSFATE